jgi:hypothetical protein
MLRVSLSLRRGASSGCGWRRRPTDMEGSWKFVYLAAADSRHCVVLQLWGLGKGLTPYHKKIQLILRKDSGY